MSLIANYFGKTTDNLTYGDIINYFNVEREETDKIEFKAFHGNDNMTEKFNGVLRSLTAFLNSGGGMLIWGAPVGQTIADKKEKVFQGALSPLDTLIEKDAFINKASDSINPAPRGITFVRLEDGNDFLYVLEIEESKYAPHQFRNIYYMRLDGQTRPAPHHYIEALFKQIRYPNLKGFIKLEQVTTNGQRIFLTLTPFILNLSKLQNEYDLYLRMIITVGTFRRAADMIQNSPYGMGGHEKRVLKARDVLYYNEPYTCNDQIEFDYDAIMATNGVFEILLYFGGKSSPLLISKYTLRFDFNNLRPGNLNAMFTSIKENIPVHEHSDGLGQTEQQRITAFIGR